MIKSQVHKSNQWAGENCGRQTCLVCYKGQEGGGDCRRRNVVYQSSCLQCRTRGKVSVYYSETSRTVFERGLEHQSDFASQKEESHMMKHVLTDHPGQEEVNFEMKVLRGHLSAFSRQIHEAVVIIRNREKNILNSKEEYNRCLLPTLAVKMGEKEHKTMGKKKAKLEMSELEEELSIAIGKDKKRKEEGGHGLPKEKRRRRWIGENSQPELKRKRENLRETNKSDYKKRKKENIIQDECQPEEKIKKPIREKNIQTKWSVKSTPSPGKILSRSKRSRHDNSIHDTRANSSNFKNILEMFKNIAEKNSNSRKTIPSNCDTLKNKSEAFSNPREKGTNQIGEEINLKQDKPNSTQPKSKNKYPNPVVKSIPAKMPRQHISFHFKAALKESESQMAYRPPLPKEKYHLVVC